MPDPPSLSAPLASPPPAARPSEAVELELGALEATLAPLPQPGGATGGEPPRSPSAPAPPEEP